MPNIGTEPNANQNFKAISNFWFGMLRPRTKQPLSLLRFGLGVLRGDDEAGMVEVAER